MYCFEKVLMALLWVLAPCSDTASGEYSPLPHSLRLWCCAIKIGKCSENKQIFISERHELLFHEHLQFRTQYGMDFAQTVRKGYWRQFRFLRVVFVSLLLYACPTRFFWHGPVFVLPIIKLFRDSTSHFFKVSWVWAQFRNCFEGHFCSGNVPVRLGNGENAIYPKCVWL